jgi:hypothetical protein
VEMDLKDGLVKDIEIEVGSMNYVQMLDYIGIPFQCSRCQKGEILLRDIHSIKMPNLYFT